MIVVHHTNLNGTTYNNDSTFEEYFYRQARKIK